MVEMPSSLHFVLSFVVIAPSKLKFSCLTARLWHRVWKSQVLQCLFSTSAGCPATAGRCDCRNDLAGLREVILDLYRSDAMALSVDDFPDT